MSKPPVTAIANWFGSNRTLAHNVGAALKGADWVGIPFCGGMSELLHIDARTVLVGDLHTHVLNLAAVVAHPLLNVQLRDRLAGLPFHPDVLCAAQERCRRREADADDDWFGVGLAENEPDLDWACDYFVAAWMSRNGSAGTRGEFHAGQSVRWDAGGGDSATRFRHATEGLAAWQAVMRKCNFVRDDCFAFLAKVKDQAGHAVYADPPFPSVGDGYKFAFTESDQRRLADKLASFRACKVVIRYYRHELIERLYPESHWEWHEYEGRRQTNDNDAPEVLLVNRRSL